MSHKPIAAGKSSFDLIDLATVEISLFPEPTESPIVDEGWQPGDVVRDALRAAVDARALAHVDREVGSGREHQGDGDEHLPLHDPFVPDPDGQCECRS